MNTHVMLWIENVKLFLLQFNDIYDSALEPCLITIDKNLTWEQQIDFVCRNVSRKLTLMKLLSKYVNQNSLKQYYNSYVFPVFFLDV